MIKLNKTSDRWYLFIPMLILRKLRVLIPPTGCNCDSPWNIWWRYWITKTKDSTTFFPASQSACIHGNKGEVSVCNGWIQAAYDMISVCQIKSSTVKGEHIFNLITV